MLNNSDTKTHRHLHLTPSERLVDQAVSADHQPSPLIFDHEQAQARLDAKRLGLVVMALANPTVGKAPLLEESQGPTPNLSFELRLLAR